MKYRPPIITVVIIVILSDAAWPLENLSIRSPIVSGTVPPSSIHSGLIQSPNPIDTRGNLVITGNVIGGKHFRGPVPYGSTASFRGPVSSSSLDSFLRYSADLQDVGPYTDGYGPYYSPTGTVAIATPGQPGTFTPAIARSWARAGLLESGLSADRVAMPGGQAMSDLDTSAFQTSLRPMSRTPQELEKVISDELGGVLPQHDALKNLRTERLPLTQSGSEQYQDGIGQFQHELKQNLTAEALYAEGRDTPAAAGAGSPPRKRGHEGRTSIVHRPSSVVPDFPQTRPSLQRQPPFLLSQESTGGVFTSDSAELDELIRVAEKKANALQQGGVPKLTTKQTDKQQHIYEQIKQRLDDLVEPDTSAASRLPSKPVGADERKPYEQPQASSELSRMSSVDHRTPYSGTQNKSFSSFSQEKFDWYIEAAQVYLKQGRYYRAVDCYTLATVYKPGDPLAYVGKSQALFAAGEYIGSALFLSRALQILPEYASVKVDLIDVLGGQDKLEKRIADAEHRLKISGASELQFLLGYIYYQLGRIDEAQRAIDVADQQIRNSATSLRVAVSAVKKAIDEAVAGSQSTIK